MAETYKLVELDIDSTGVPNQYKVQLSIEGDDKHADGNFTLDINQFPRGLDPEDYARKLSQDSVFSGKDFGELFAQLRQYKAQNPIRVRLQIKANELNVLQWERLEYPDGNARWQPIATDNKQPFSRYISTQSIGDTPPKAKFPLKVLTIVASPTGLGAYSLAPIPPSDREALYQCFSDTEKFEVTKLESGTESKPTWANLEAEINKGEGYDIVHFLCHGQLSKKNQETGIFLENAEGEMAIIKGQDLIDLFRSAPHTPKLCVFMSCETAMASTKNQSFIPLAPRLIREANIDAVIAMSDTVKMITARDFTEKFYDSLVTDGVVDLAMSKARFSVKTGVGMDWAVPVLFMQPRDGVLWNMEEKKPLDRRVRDALMDCGPFGSENAVYGTFRNSEKIRLWANRLPGASSPLGRMEATMAFLIDKYKVDGKNGLHLFLQVLADNWEEGSDCKPRLQQLANEVGNERNKK